ncbi:hypothetical protein [Clostridium estertheticum]|uniref:Uncharacterized protein n=1 Tax=Clostridium estertheticum TaxID=238834 RepID=A0AA47ELN2_9CLOT|nr:hypothetical protein [Clostridium estertheticum]MBU3153471.1 hypothetical protein [Clostridium estertheticum]WAG60873.1 hypothetical protein LL038_01075 [Clostridium estertheticum]
MGISFDIVEEAIEILENGGVLFEDSTKVGSKLLIKPERAEIKELIENNFTYDIICSCLNIPVSGDEEKRETKYFLYVPDILFKMYPNNDETVKIVRFPASVHYGVPIDSVNFDFI